MPSGERSVKGLVLMIIVPDPQQTSPTRLKSSHRQKNVCPAVLTLRTLIIS